MNRVATTLLRVATGGSFLQPLHTRPAAGSCPPKRGKSPAQRLADLRRPVELLVIPGVGHVFNFRDRRQAGLAWDALEPSLTGTCGRKKRS